MFKFGCLSLWMLVSFVCLDTMIVEGALKSSEGYHSSRSIHNGSSESNDEFEYNPNLFLSDLNDIAENNNESDDDVEEKREASREDKSRANISTDSVPDSPDDSFFDEKKGYDFSSDDEEKESFDDTQAKWESPTEDSSPKRNIAQLYDDAAIAKMYDDAGDSFKLHWVIDNGIPADAVTLSESPNSKFQESGSLDWKQAVEGVGFLLTMSLHKKYHLKTLCVLQELNENLKFTYADRNSDLRGYLLVGYKRNSQGGFDKFYEGKDTSFQADFFDDSVRKYMQQLNH
eukprot:825411_1